MDKKRLKPGKILLPHPLHPINDESEDPRICLITADPQRKYKDLVSQSPALQKKIKRVLGLEKLKAKYKSYESRRQLRSEYDIFLADDRIITYLPQFLGKTFYQISRTRPIPVSLEGKREGVIDEQGNKRRKLSEGGTKVVRAEPQVATIEREIERALQCALVHLSPSTTTAVRVGTSGMEAEHVCANIEAVVEGLVKRYVPSGWRGVRSLHIKGPETVALPVWVAEELWEGEEEVLEEAPASHLAGGLGKKKKKKREFLAEDGAIIEVPGPDGKMRVLEAPSKAAEESDSLSVKAGKKRKSVEGEDAKADEKAEREARKASLKRQKEMAKTAATKDLAVTKKSALTTNGDIVKKVIKKSRMKAVDLV